MVRTARILMTVAFAAPATLWTQQAVVPTPDTVPSAFLQLELNRKLRMSLSEGQRREGRLAGLDQAARVLSLHDQSTPILVGAIDTLWVGQHATKKGAVIGAATVGIASALFWGAFCSGLSGGDCDEWGKVIAYSAVGATAGAGVGALIGRGIPRWGLRYVRTPASPERQLSRAQPGQMMLFGSLPIRVRPTDP